MGKLKKAGTNSKAEEAKGKKEAEKESKKEREAKAKVEAEWRDAGDGQRSKAQQKKESQAAAAAEAAAKKAEAKKLAAAEEAEMASLAKKKADKAKVTNFQLQKTRDADAKEWEKRAKEHEAAAKRSTTEDTYGAMVDAENVNRQADGVEARNVEDAIAALDVGGAAEPDAHPERRMKAAHLAFEEETIKQLRLDKPGLRTSQYKEQAWKLWQKSPENPMNQLSKEAEGGRRKG